MSPAKTFQTIKMSLIRLLRIDKEHGMQEDISTAERSYVLNSVKYLDLKYVACGSPSDGVSDHIRIQNTTCTF